MKNSFDQRYKISLMYDQVDEQIWKQSLEQLLDPVSDQIFHNIRNQVFDQILM